MHSYGFTPNHDRAIHSPKEALTKEEDGYC